MHANNAQTIKCLSALKQQTTRNSTTQATTPAASTDVWYNICNECGSRQKVAGNNKKLNVSFMSVWFLFFSSTALHATKHLLRTYFCCCCCFVLALRSQRPVSWLTYNVSAFFISLPLIYFAFICRCCFCYCFYVKFKY